MIIIIIIIIIIIMITIIIKVLEIMVQERYQDIILVRMETFYSSICISALLVFEFLISFLNVSKINKVLLLLL